MSVIRECWLWVWEDALQVCKGHASKKDAGRPSPSCWPQPLPLLPAWRPGEGAPLRRTDPPEEDGPCPWDPGETPGNLAPRVEKSSCGGSQATALCLTRSEM